MLKITIYKGNGDKVGIINVKKEPTLEALQKAVGGYIEMVPEAFYLESNKDWFNRRHPGDVRAVWCNEEGKLDDNATANPFFAPAPWGDSLYGNVVVVEKLGNGV